MATRVGIVGAGYGASVLLPAFRAGGFDVVAIASRDGERAAAAATEHEIANAFADVHALLALDELDAVAIAVPPLSQERIAVEAAGRGLHVFAEKPMSVTVEGARRMESTARAARIAHVVDFNFREIAAFDVVRNLVRAGAVGALRNVTVTWHVESYANRERLTTWKTDQESGGGSLFNFVSHSLDYLERLIGPVEALSARLAGIPGDRRPNDAFVAMAFALAGGVPGSLTMSAASYRGSGHRIEIYGEDGTIILANDGSDYMRGFRVFHAVRPGNLNEIEVACETDPWADGRILPVSRLVRRFRDWIQNEQPSDSDFSAGLRAQILLQAAQIAHKTGCWVECPAAERGLTDRPTQQCDSRMASDG